jgi:hypothetical protein
MTPFGSAWALAGAHRPIGPIVTMAAKTTMPARAAKRVTGVNADRASLTLEADGNGGLVLRSDTRDAASLSARCVLIQVDKACQRLRRAVSLPRIARGGGTVVEW